MLRKILSSAALTLVMMGAAVAAPPSTLGYQGNLADAGGNPISTPRNITFRLYDTASGGVALWTEALLNVPIDGGNLAVELGQVTPLPKDIWGKQLYLGVTIAGDSEMLPRPALTAAPYALRAGATMKNTVLVSADGTATENGTALLAAMAAITTATASNPVTLELDAGTFDLGNARLNMPQYVTLVGRGRDATLIQSTHEFGTLRVNSNTEVRSLTARNSSIPSSDSAFPAPFGIGGFVDPAPNVGPIDNVRLTDVTGKNIAASGTLNARQGIYLCANNTFTTNVTAIADGGNFSMGFRADCAAGSNGMFIDGLKVFSSGGAQGVRGAYLAGGGPWKDIQAFVTTSATAQTVFGIRTFSNTADSGAALINPMINISSPVDWQPFTDSAGITVDGLRIDRSEVAVLGGFIGLERVVGAFLRGINTIHIPGDDLVKIDGTSIHMEVLKPPSFAGGIVNAIQLNSSGGELSKLKINVECKATTNVACSGIKRQPAVINNVTQAMQDEMVEISNSNVYVTQENPGVGGISHALNVNAGGVAVVNSKLHTWQLTAGEPSVTLLVGDAGGLQVFNSVLLSDGSMPDGVGGVLGSVGTGVLRLHSNSLLGTISGTAVCVGNSTLADNFLASTCP